MLAPIQLPAAQKFVVPQTNFFSQNAMQLSFRPPIQFSLPQGQPRQATSNLVQKSLQEKNNQINNSTQQLLQDINAKIQLDLQDYIKRGFAKCLNNHERSLMQKFLRNVIKSSQTDSKQRSFS